MDAVRLALAALACYRLAQLVTIDDGPGDAFRRLRAWAITGFISGVVHCVYCAGVWFALPLAILVLYPTAGGDLVLAILGIAGAQSYLQGPREAGSDV